VIKAVGFDFDHTLGIDNKLERVAFLRLLDDACGRGARRVATMNEEIEHIDAILAAQRAGEFTIEQAVDRFMREHGVADAELYVTRYKQMCVEMVDTFVIQLPGAREMLNQLRRREIPAAILTNGWSPLQQYKAHRVDFMGPVLVSSDIGVQKPDAAAFEALARSLQTPLHEVAFVGDTPASDIAGALEVGMHAIWLDAEGVRYPSGLPPPAAVIHSLAELPGIV
jgi:HAD superfamily hydrolase (TIGR01549 family)